MINWEDEINALDVEDLSEKGLDAPEMENIRPKRDLSQKGRLQRLTTHTYIFEPEDEDKTFSSQLLSITEWGDITFETALVILMHDKRANERQEEDT